ncbi:hypothetical protein EN962_20690 [Mesorhizobium sp. M7A.F.Ca.CA.001.09.2.1]|uniref:Uncharacterized protein n=1 Tax=Mesorhizobium ciceri TaxID=39645 RepID=A0AB38T4C9_9HYPH|nr:MULTISPECIES: hypothetical protein [Mesorhizobium]RUY40776.1 hypothetical protein EN981_22235 [Mesorhizobium sp. M7A.F.Ca.CA.001.13.2.1]MDF3212810.1 hypothetical protein [Mesorhizobium ciceri]RUY64379.1 hypothetical protein EN965_21170 [Mesorhizobium sp. M7A.F.Ca.CA.001.05.1.1]RUY65914.1 hypothetical protein EN980_21510 [Mesorhizobium sp. M7A.F.Ca.CA.001.13.1.1]RUY76157.1 hypothetical protein EN962_20690 [Mesorhizobium sp. M7A.F.Ca.CA.001.09.2.1]
MKKFALVLTAAMVSFSTVGAYAGGWGGSSGSLINVSPSIGVGQVTALNGILSGNNILSGNVVQGILNGNKTNVLTGVLSGIGVNVLGGNSYKLGGRR